MALLEYLVVIGLFVLTWHVISTNQTDIDRLKERTWAYELCISEINHGTAYNGSMFAQCVDDYRSVHQP